MSDKPVTLNFKGGLQNKQATGKVAPLFSMTDETPAEETDANPDQAQNSSEDVKGRASQHGKRVDLVDADRKYMFQFQRRRKLPH